MKETQEQQQKANNAIALLREALDKAREAKLYGEVTIRVNMQNGQIGHYERNVRETYK
jgi:hypothetical protein